MAKILIIEDNDTVLLGLEKTFTEENFEVVTARTGEKGLAKTESQNPDVIVLDRDIFAVPPADIRDTEVQLTIFDGQIVYHTAAL